MDGENPGYTNWQPGEPNGQTNENYALMFADTGTWVDAGDAASGQSDIGNHGLVEVASSVGSNDCSGAPPITFGTWGFNTIGATTDGPSSCNVLDDVWFKYTACANGSHTITTCSLANFDTALQVLSGTCGELVPIACNDDACGLQSSITWTAIAGTTYYLRVGVFEGLGGSGAVELTGPACQSCPSMSIAQGPIVNPINGHRYYRLSPSNWSCAELYAVNQLGGHLASVSDAAENGFIYNTFANVSGSGPVWLGLTDYITAGAFVYTNGDPLSYTQWGSGQPDDSGGVERWVCLYSGPNFGNGDWVDVQDSVNPGVGNVSGVVELPALPCGPISVVLKAPSSTPLMHTPTTSSATPTGPAPSSTPSRGSAATSPPSTTPRKTTSCTTRSPRGPARYGSGLMTPSTKGHLPM